MVKIKLRTLLQESWQQSNAFQKTGRFCQEQFSSSHVSASTISTADFILHLWSRQKETCGVNYCTREQEDGDEMKEAADKGWICSSDRIVRSNDRSSLGRDQIVTLSSWLNTRFCRVQQKLSVTRGTLQLGRGESPSCSPCCSHQHPDHNHKYVSTRSFHYSVLSTSGRLPSFTSTFLPSSYSHEPRNSGKKYQIRNTIVFRQRVTLQILKRRYFFQRFDTSHRV